MSGTIFFICLTSAISALSAALRISAWPAAPQRWRKGCKNRRKDNRIVAKSKPTTMNLVFSVSTSSSTVNSPIASKSPGKLKSTVETWRKRSQSSTASSSSRMARRSQLHVRTASKLVATDEDQKHLNYPEDVSTGKFVAPGYPGNSGNSGTEGNDEDWPHQSPYFNKLCAAHGEGFLDRETKIRIKWRITTWTQLSVTLRAAVHLGKDYTENLRSTKNQPKKSLRQLFQVTERLITDQTTTIDWQQPMWRETTLSTDRAVQCATAKTQVFSDSVLCLGGISDEPVQAWESKIEWVFGNKFSRIFGSDRREPMKFKWKDFPGCTSWGILDEVQNMMTESKCELEQFNGRMIFMPMYNDIDLGKRGNKENCIANALRVTEYARRFTQGHWSFLEPGSENPCQQTWWRRRKLLKVWCSTLPKAEIVYFVSAALWKEENWKAKEWNPFNSTVVNWFFAQLFPSISSVSTEQ